MNLNLVGQKFERLTVIGRAGTNKHRCVLWKCLCDCGNFTLVISSRLRAGHTKSCGCLCKEKASERMKIHGMGGTPTYNTWSCMVNRCNNPDNIGYSYYGGRGITVCKRWLKFEDFFEDMGIKPKGLTIERKDNELGYFKENCCWATMSDQSKNKRIQKNNKTGVNGVCWHPQTKKYQASIRVNGEQKYIGLFVSLKQAAKARKQAEQKYWT